MKKVIDFIKEHNYLMILLIFIGFSISLSLTYSNFIVTSNNHKAAEMYIGELKYSIEIDGTTTNTLTVPAGETIIDVKVNNLNPVDTYYKLLYLNNSNLEIKYFSETKDTDEVKTNYKSPNDSVTSSNTNNLKLFIRNNSTTSQNVSFSLKGGYINNTLSDISVPSGYSEITTIEVPSSNTYFCKTDSTLTQGLEYVNGQYTYGYKKEGYYASSELAWNSISNNGWGVQLTDKASTDAVTSKLCTYINNKPVVSMGCMFYNSKAITLNLSSFNTSNVTDMSGMFYGSQATTLNLSNFDTSNVTDMSSMFGGSQATTLDVSNFDTSKVIYMLAMFSSVRVATIKGLENFDTSKVKNMSNMFSGSQATTLDVSNFDTSNVTYMDYMFFASSKVTTLDLSSFDTSKVKNMSNMFASSSNLKAIYVSDRFNTDAVNNSASMFKDCTFLVGGSGTVYDSSKIDKTYARIDGGTSNPGYFTDVSQKPSTFDTDDWATIVKSVKEGNTRKYKVGDTKTIDMGSYGTHTLRIANTSTPSECSTTGFSQTACGFVLEFVDTIAENRMNNNGGLKGTNVKGWPATTMRTFINNDIYNSLPEDLKSRIINTTVVSGHGSEDTANFTSIDKLYLLSTAEIWAQGTSNKITSDSARNMTRQLDYYKAQGTSTDNYSAAIKKSDTIKNYWGLRSSCSDSNFAFHYVTSSGNHNGDSGLTGSIGVSPAFRIG